MKTFYYEPRYGGQGAVAQSPGNYGAALDPPLLRIGKRDEHDGPHALLDEVFFPKHLKIVGTLHADMMRETEATVTASYVNNRGQTCEPLALYAHRALKSLEWRAISIDGADDAEDFQDALFTWRWDFAVQKHPLVIQPQAKTPVFAWGGRYVKGAGLDRIAPLYCTFLPINGLTDIQFLSHVLADECVLCGDDHPAPEMNATADWPPNTPRTFLNHITFGSLQTIVGTGPLSAHYRSVEVLDYDSQHDMVKILFTRDFEK